MIDLHYEATYRQILGLSVNKEPNFVTNYIVVPLNSVCHQTEFRNSVTSPLKVTFPHISEKHIITAQIELK